MFRFFRQRPRWGTSESPRENFLRILLLFVVLGLTGYGFWWNAQRQNELLQDTSAGLRDPGAYFSQDEQKQFTVLSKAFKDKFGLKLVLEVLPDGPLKLPELDAMSVYVGVSVKPAEALVDFPPWLVKLMGEGYVSNLEKKLQASLKSTDNTEKWRQTLADTLVGLGRRVEEVISR